MNWIEIMSAFATAINMNVMNFILFHFFPFFSFSVPFGILWDAIVCNFVANQREYCVCVNEAQIIINSTTAEKVC